MRRRQRRIAAASAALLLVLALVGCGGGGGDDDADDGGGAAGDEAGPLSFEQAEVLGTTLFRNHEEGGAQVELEAPITDDLTLVAEGEVDFAGPAGHLTGEVRSGEQADPFEVYFTADRLYADVAAIEAQGGGPYPEGTEWVVRPPTQELPLDIVIGLLTGLASEDRDNPALIADDEENGVVRSDEVDGAAVTVFDHGELVRLWVDGEGLTRRAELEVTGFAERVQIDLHDHGPQQVELPPESSVHVEVEPAPPAEGG